MTTLRRVAIMAVGLVTCATLTGWPVSGVQSAPTTAKAYFAGGCFWCMEEAFEKVDGVLAAVSGYMGGTVANPTYEEVSAGRTGHAEAVEAPMINEVTYQKLLDAFGATSIPSRRTRNSATTGRSTARRFSIPPMKKNGLRKTRSARSKSRNAFLSPS